MLAPNAPTCRFSVELFSRLSLTRGDDDETGRNDYKSLTLGANLGYRKLRGSLNLLYGESRDSVRRQNDGMSFVLRGQYLF
jgi:hypothetical protein